MTRYQGARTRRPLWAFIGALLLLTTVYVAYSASAVYAAEQARPSQQGANPAVVGVNGATLYDAPTGEVITELSIATVLDPSGRSEDGEWLYVETREGEMGWVEADAVVFFGLDSLAVMDAGEMVSDADDDGAAAELTEESFADATPVPEEEAEEVATATEEPTPTATPTEEPTATSTPEPTATMTPTPEPTATATPVPPTATPTRSAASAASRDVAVVGAKGAPVYDAPEGNEVNDLGIGTAIYLIGQNEEGSWLLVETSGDVGGWVDADTVVAFNTDQLPVIDMDMATDEEPALALDISDENADAADEEMSDDASVDAGTDKDNTEITADESDADAANEDVADDASANEDVADDASANEDVADDASANDKAADDDKAATPAPTATRTPRPTPIVAEGDVTGKIVLTGSRLNVRSGPGTGNPIVTKAYPSEEFLVTGRNSASTWVEIALPDEDPDSGWVSVNYIRLSEPVAGLPVTSEEPAVEVTSETQSDESMPAESDSDAESEESNARPAESDSMATSSAPAPNVSTGPTGLSGKLAFQTQASGDIYLYDLASGQARWLAKGYEPEISRDGSKVAFIRIGGNDQGVWAINSDGSNERKVFGNENLPRGPKWSPDGSRIVFSRSAGYWECDDLGFGICIDLPPCPDDAVAPDFDCPIDNIETETRKNPQYKLATVNANGDEYRDLNVLHSAQAPDWNEGGIVYDAVSTIEITDDKPGAQTRRVYAENWTDDADWQPGGGLIAYQSRQGSHWEIFVIPPENGSPAALTRPKTTLVDQLPSNVAPAWSPDGNHVVFLSNREENNEAGDWRIWVMNADGSDQRPLPVNIPIEYSYNHTQPVSWGR